MRAGPRAEPRPSGGERGSTAAQAAAGAHPRPPEQRWFACLVCGLRVNFIITTALSSSGVESPCRCKHVFSYSHLLFA